VRAAGAEVHTVRADLRTIDGIDKVHRAVVEYGRPLDAAALDAGVGRGGPFLDTDIADEVEIIDLNITSTLWPAERLLRDMAARDEGQLLITSSIASTMLGTFQAVYNASKSFLQSFAEAVANELKDTGVTITSLMPGPTETDFFHRADMGDTKVGASSKDDPAGGEAGLRGPHEGPRQGHRGRRRNQAPGRSREGVARQRQGGHAPLDRNLSRWLRPAGVRRPLSRSPCWCCRLAG
jgi:uncharacterized protein